MNQQFQGWEAVAERLRQAAEKEKQLEQEKGENAPRLNRGQRASLHAIAERIVNNGVVIADEVGMGKTRIAVELARCVIESGGRVAILVPPGLGYQWQAELREGRVNDAPHILRSLWEYLRAWETDEAENQQPWFEKQAVMVSHAFTNWQLGERTDPWRWALLPELYARWREKTEGRLPRGYHDNEKLYCAWPRNAAMSITAAVPSYQKYPKNPVRRLLDQLMDVQWPTRPLDAAEYSRDGEMRDWLERGVGFGLGVFDLIIFDEAHKSRQDESGLSRLLENVIVPSNTARRVALTATPVELDVSQWKNILRRIGLDDSALNPIRQVIDRYADAVHRVRQVWKSNKEAREAYKIAATCFKDILSPYLIRRDKGEDPDVQLFHDYSGLPIHEYRRESEIIVEANDLPWRRAICAAESLSMVTRLSDDPEAKRLRLTLGNGHGIAVWLDQIRRQEDDHKQEAHDEIERASNRDEEAAPRADAKQQERVKWWLGVIKQAFTLGDESLYSHPAILAAVKAIEEATQQDEKVLVFGRFTRPLRAMVNLLNAREMLWRVQKEEPWPQTKVHGDRDGNADDSEWPAVRAAHCQLKSPLQLETLDEVLRTRYEKERRLHERFRENLIARIEDGWKKYNPGMHMKAIFDAFKHSVATTSVDEREEQDSLILVARAMLELMGNIDDEIPSTEYTKAFCELIDAVCDKDDMDIDHEMNDDEAAEQWDKIKSRLDEEYNRPQGGFARLMYGGTRQESRRMIQLAFNRRNSFPHVLVAQSLVGREGLNLHKSCRIVVLLHPEWNPAVVEQQIGRVDRVGSHWCNKLDEAIQDGKQGDQIPRIEVRPVIFCGTYDEHNWQVLRTRWNDLRAQLHGIVIPPSEAINNRESSALIEEIFKAAPIFSPTGRYE
jgi:ERCC4-related helicase